MRSYTRLSNGFSRKICNFIKIHTTIRTSSAMAASIVDRLSDVSDLVAMLIESEEKAA